MRVVRDRWGDKWVRYHNPTTHVPFSWASPTHTFTYLRQLGRIPEVRELDG